MSLMSTALVTSGDAQFSPEQVALGDPEANEVLVEIRASGVCHTDLDILNWRRPLILGHEGAGVVAATGAGVDHVRPGDRVVLNWAIPCGECFQCRRGAESLCEAKPHVANDRLPLGRRPLWPSFGLGTMATHAWWPKAGGGEDRGRHPLSVRRHPGLRRDDRLRLGDQRGEGRAGRDRRGAGLRRGRPELHPGRGACGGADDHRRRRQPGPAGAGARRSARRTRCSPSATTPA